jgi:CcmD family protein
MSHLYSLLAAGQDFQPFTPGESGTAQVSAPLYVLLAYSIIWLVLLGYVASLHKRHKDVERELRDLKQELEG